MKGSRLKSSDGSKNRRLFSHRGHFNDNQGVLGGTTTLSKESLKEMPSRRGASTLGCFTVFIGAQGMKSLTIVKNSVEKVIFFFFSS